MLKLIDEETLIAAKKMLGDNSPFAMALSIVQQYKEAELTPVIYTDDQTKTIHVTTEEFVHKKFH